MDIVKIVSVASKVAIKHVQDIQDINQLEKISLDWSNYISNLSELLDWDSIPDEISIYWNRVFNVIQDRIELLTSDETEYKVKKLTQDFYTAIKVNNE